MNKRNKRPTRDSQAQLDAQLISAVCADNVTALRSALDRGANPSSTELGESALHLASGHSLECVEELLRAGADLRRRESGGSNAAIQAAKCGQLGILRRLRKAGFLMDAVDRDGRSALMLAAREGNAECVEALLSMSVKVGRIDNRSRTALYLACSAFGKKSESQIACARLLVQGGAWVDARDELGITPLMAAAYTGQSCLVEYLIEAGAKIEARDCRGLTALMYASENGAVESLSSLLALGADAQARCSEGKTAEERGFNIRYSVGGLYLAAERERLALEAQGSSRVIAKKEAVGKRL